MTLLASDTQVRLLEDGRPVASHRRCFDRDQLVIDPAHQQALLEQKRQALGATPSGRLLAAAPEIEALRRQSPRASSVAFILSQRHRLKRQRLPAPVNLSRRPDLEHLHVQPHDPETYDELADTPDE